MSASAPSSDERSLAARIDVLETAAIRGLALVCAGLLLVGTVIPIWSFLAERGGDDDDWHSFGLWSSMLASFGAESVHSNEDYWVDKFSLQAGIALLILLACVCVAAVLCLPMALRTMPRVGSAIARVVAVVLVPFSAFVFVALVDGDDHPSVLDPPVWVYIAGVVLFVALAFSPGLRRLASGVDRAVR